MYQAWNINHLQKLLCWVLTYFFQGLLLNILLPVSLRGSNDSSSLAIRHLFFVMVWRYISWKKHRLKPFHAILEADENFKKWRLPRRSRSLETYLGSKYSMNLYWLTSFFSAITKERISSAACFPSTLENGSKWLWTKN